MAHTLIFIFNALSLLLLPTIFLTLSVAVAIVFWKKRASRILLIVALLYVYLLGSGLIGQSLFERLESANPQRLSEQQIVGHHALILLGGGLSHYPHSVNAQITSYARVVEAARVYHVGEQHGIAYNIFISGGDTLHRGYSEAEVFRDQLLQLGVPRQQIILETKSLNTFENAKYLKPLLAKYGFKEYVLVTSALHMPRSRAYFKFFAIDTIAAPSDYPYPLSSVIPLGYNLALQEMAIHEWVGIKRLWLYNLLGLNKS